MVSSDSTYLRKIIETDDGSHTLFVPELNEHYHSSHGALQEAEHIFIKDALDFSLKGKKSLNVLEIGFGTGLNALLTMHYAQLKGLRVHYHALEKYPVKAKEYSVLNYASQMRLDETSFLDLHHANWENDVEISNGFTLRKVQVDFREMQLPAHYFDVVYFDAFGPDVQPELWSEQVFRMIYNSMKEGGVMTTYSVKGVIRRAMKSVGFDVEKIPGPVGKREISRAIKML